MASRILLAETGSWHVKCNLTGEEGAEFMWEVERYQLDIVGFTSTDSVISEAKLLDKG